MMGPPDGEKNLEDIYIYIRLDSIPACDRQTDGQTSCHGIVRAMHTRRAAKNGVCGLLSLIALTALQRLYGVE